MLDADWFAVVMRRNQCVIREEFLNWEISCPAIVVAIGENILALGLKPACEGYDVACGDTFPDVTETRPARDAMEIRENPHAWKPLKLIVRQADFVPYQPAQL
jgi:hypothetical protein